MKRITYMAVVLAASLLMSGCSMLGGSTGTTSTNSNNSTALTSALGSALTTAATGSTNGSANILGSLLSTLLGGTTTTKQTIVGTWNYSAPEVRFESENILSQIGGTVASSKIQSTLGTQLNKIGLKKGQSTFTFNSDGSLIVTMNGKKTTGTYTYNSNNQTVTMTGALGMATINATVAVNENTMYMLFDSSKLLAMATNLGSSNTSLSSLTSLLGNYTGLKLGWSMTK